MSENPVDPPVTDEKAQPINLADYEDISGDSIAEPLSRTPSISTQVPAPVLSTTHEHEHEHELETESESEYEDAQEPNKDVQEPDDDYGGAIGIASILLAGGMVVAGLAMFLTQPVVMEHPWSRRDYF